MIETRLHAQLNTLLAIDGITGAALVDLDTGMVVRSAGAAKLAALAEAASDYWRLCLRQPLFAALGPLRAQAAMHEHGRVTLVGCGPGLLLVTLSREDRGVDWTRWKGAVAQLQQLAAGL